jgi:hypothetical protein
MVANSSTFTSLSTPAPISAGGVFQSVGAGYHYLPSDSPYRNQGTTNIDSQLLSDLRKKTTSAPVLLTNSITSLTVLSPCVQRDTATPALGYHYEPLDYIFHEVALTNATLILTNGVAIGTYGTRGISLQPGAQLISQGSPIAPNRIGHANRVQEQPTFVTDWLNYGWLECTSSQEPRAQLHFNFTDFSFLAGPDYARNLAVWLYYYPPAVLDIRNSFLQGTYTVVTSRRVSGLTPPRLSQPSAKTERSLRAPSRQRAGWDGTL